MKQRINLDKVALIGRTFEEYYQIFRLSDFNSNHVKILDIGSGVSSFCAEALERGMNVTAMDTIYEYSANELKVKCADDLDLIIEELNGVEYLYHWNIFKNKENLRKQRERAYKKFIEHYRENNSINYVPKEMPHTSFENDQFDIIISSHLLFLYDHIFDYEFHKKTIMEMLRICSKEIRIFPLVNLYGNKSPFLSRIWDDDSFLDYKKSIEKVEYEFIRGGNEFLRIIKAK